MHGHFPSNTNLEVLSLPRFTLPFPFPFPFIHTTINTLISPSNSHSTHNTLSLSLSPMANSRALVATIILVGLVVLHGVESIDVTSSNGNNSTGLLIDCGGSCATRCSMSKRPNLCKRACGSCCAKCNCVPPGTYGNYEACPCYATLTTRGNKLKCP